MLSLSFIRFFTVALSFTEMAFKLRLKSIFDFERTPIFGVIKNSGFPKYISFAVVVFETQTRGQERF